MDISVIIVLVLGIIIVVGGPIVGHYASKASEKADHEESSKSNTKK